MNISGRFYSRVGYRRQSRNSDQFSPRHIRFHFLELTAEHTLESQIRVTGNKYDRRYLRSRRPVRRMIDIHSEGFCSGVVLKVFPDCYCIHTRYLVNHAFFCYVVGRRFLAHLYLAYDVRFILARVRGGRAYFFLDFFRLVELALRCVLLKVFMPSSTTRFARWGPNRPSTSNCLPFISL